MVNFITCLLYNDNDRIIHFENYTDFKLRWRQRDYDSIVWFNHVLPSINYELSADFFFFSVFFWQSNAKNDSSKISLKLEIKIPDKHLSANEFLFFLVFFFFFLSLTYKLFTPLICSLFSV